MTWAQRLILVAGAVATVVGGYVTWKTWEDAACPTAEEVEAAYARIDPDYEPRPDRDSLLGLEFAGPFDLHQWTLSKPLRVGDWEFRIGAPSHPLDRVVHESFECRFNGHWFRRHLVARPVSSMSRFRLMLRDSLGTPRADDFYWRPPG